MAQEFKLPELGENIESVEVTAVLVAAGDAVTSDQPLLEVETEKASLEVPAPFAGIIEQVHVKAGDTIRVGQTLLTIEPRGDVVSEPAEVAAAKPEPPPEPPPEPARPEPQPTRVEAPTPGAAKPHPAPPPSATTAGRSAAHAIAEPPAKVLEFAKPVLGEPIPAAPSVRRLARELGVEIARVPGSGPAGRISIDDVKLYAKRLLTREARSGGGAAPADLPDFSRWGEVERKPLSGLRRAAGENLSRAWATIPHVTQFDQADVTELEALRKRYKDRAAARGGKLTMTAIALKVAASALNVFPQFNASLDPGRDEVVFKKYVHLGVAVDTERGLLVPVIRDVDRKNIVEISAELTDLAERARNRRISPDELSGASFTVTNLGGLGTTYFTPIVNWPEVAILGVGRAETRAVYRDGGFVPRAILPLSVSYDHRWIDGADAARFLRWIAEALEQPMLVALEG